MEPGGSRSPAKPTSSHSFPVQPASLPSPISHTDEKPPPAISVPQTPYRQTWGPHSPGLRVPKFMQKRALSQLPETWVHSLTASGTHLA